MQKLILTLLVSLFSNQLYAFPIDLYQSLDAPLNIIDSRDNNYDFNGIVALSNCSGSLIHFAGQPTSSPAYLLTNGHCVGGFGGFIKPGEVRYNKPDNRTANAFIDINNRVKIRTTKLAYATMTNTDVAIFQLNETYDDLIKKGVHSFELSALHPVIGQNIQVISGYWRKGFTCEIEFFSYELHEGGWTMKDSIRYSPTGCEVYGGTSGSPIIAKDERVVVGINNTGNESGEKCLTNNPCEVDNTGNTTVIKGRGYGQQTFWLNNCLTEEFEIDLSKKDCQLPKP
jgi:V8-like Glu-specific endopeptidase